MLSLSLHLRRFSVQCFWFSSHSSRLVAFWPFCCSSRCRRKRKLEQRKVAFYSIHNVRVTAWLSMQSLNILDCSMMSVTLWKLTSYLEWLFQARVVFRICSWAINVDGEFSTNTSVHYCSQTCFYLLHHRMSPLFPPPPPVFLHSLSCSTQIKLSEEQEMRRRKNKLKSTSVMCDAL